MVEVNHKEEYLKNVEVLENAIAVLPEDNKNYAFFTNYKEAMARACKNEEKMDDRKWIYLDMVSNAVMRQIVYILFDQKLLTADLEKTYRSRRTAEDVNNDWKVATDALQAEKDEIVKQVQAFDAIEEDLGKFQSVAIGRSKSFADADRKNQQYKEMEAKAAAQGQA